MSWIADPVDGGVIIRSTSPNWTHGSPGVVLRSGRGGSAMVTPEDVKAIVAAPIVFGTHNYGVLFGGYRGARECGDRAQQLLDGVAQRCAEALFFEKRLRIETENAVRCERRRAADTLSGLVRDLRETERLMTGDHPLAERVRKIERHAMESATELRQSLDLLLEETVDYVARAMPVQTTRRVIANREYDVLRRVAMGETNQEIASAMSLSCNTIKTYLRNAMSKLGARNRVEAIVYAKDQGLL